jgi:hypothetical protein
MKLSTTSFDWDVAGRCDLVLNDEEEAHCEPKKISETAILELPPL